MRAGSLLSLCVLMISGLISAQNTDYYYGRYEGKACNSIVTANLVKVFNNVSGNIDMNKIDASSSFVSLAGSIDNAGVLTLTEMGKSANTLSGAINQRNFTGIIMCNDKETEVNMISSFPEGSLKFDVFYLHSEENLVENKDDSPAAEIELVLIYPDKSTYGKAIVDSVEKRIQDSFFNSVMLSESPDSMLTNYENNYFATYKKQNENWYDNGASFNWQKIVNMSVMYNANNIVCAEYLVYAYTGGAHGITNIKYDIISLETGAKLEYSDIFTENSNANLSDLLTASLKKNVGIQQNASLKENGYFVDTIQPNYNIYVNSTGIGFVYNSYEIAPYAVGQTKIHLTFNEISPFLKSDSPVVDMIK